MRSCFISTGSHGKKKRKRRRREEKQKRRAGKGRDEKRRREENQKRREGEGREGKRREEELREVKGEIKRRERERNHIIFTFQLFSSSSSSLFVSWPLSFLIRDVLSRAANFHDAVRLLSTTPLIAPCYIIVAGKEGKGRKGGQEKEKEGTQKDNGNARRSKGRGK